MEDVHGGLGRIRLVGGRGAVKSERYMMISYVLFAVSYIDSQIQPANVVLFPLTFGLANWLAWKGTR